ncbi:hypothetical protein K402DRAFT_300199, partial [Aulographum hederae CBS 113979]
VAKGGDPEKELSYVTSWDWIKKVFRVVGIQSTSVTHAGRKSAPQKADSLGVAASHIQRAGHWNSDAMSSVYLHGISYEFIRALAGF